MGETNTLRKHPRSNYTTLQNTTLRDKCLSWKARGLFAFLWSHSQDFRFSVDWLTKNAKDGRDSTKSALGELQRHGYLTIDRVRGPDGRYTRIDWHLADEPSASRSVSNSPEAEKPFVVHERKNHTRKNGIPEMPSSTTEELCIRKTTSTELIGDERTTDLIPPLTLDPQDRRTAISAVTGRVRDIVLAQQILDELEAQLERKRVKGHWNAYLEGLIRKAEGGAFTPAAGKQVAGQRSATIPALAIRPKPTAATPESVQARFKAIQEEIRGTRVSIGGIQHD